MSSEPTLTLGTYKANDADYNGAHGQAIAALRFLSEHPPAEGGSQSFNVEHLLQIANELERSFKAIQKAAHAVPGGGASETHVSIQEAWIAAGGNPDIPATRQELLEVLRAMDEAEEEADVARARLKELETLWPDTLAAFRGAFDTPLARRRDNSEYAEDARDRMRMFNETLFPEPELSPEEQARLQAQAETAQEQLETLLYGARSADPKPPGRM
jgi:hypothetical protein